MNWFTPDLTALKLELQQLKINQQSQQARIIALLEENNKLLQQLLQK